MSAQPPAAGMPERIGARYHVLERLGRGGMAVVYRVRDPSRSGELALKQLTPCRDTQQAREQRAVFEREWRTLAQLSHPSLIEAYDFGLDPQGPYYTMELLAQTLVVVSVVSRSRRGSGGEVCSRLG
jgi:serine/threonine protein kinase